MVRLDTLVGRILRETRQRMDEGKAGEVLSLTGEVARDEGEAAHALARSDRLSPRTTVRRGAIQARREAGDALPARSLEIE